MAKCPKYQPSGAGGTRSPPATPHHLLHQKWSPEGPKIADGAGKGSNPRLLGAPINFCKISFLIQALLL